MSVCARRTRILAVAAAVLCLWGLRAAPAAALDPLKPVCSIAGFISGLLGKGCSVIDQAGGRVIGAAKQLFSGRLGSAFKALLGQASSAVRSHAGIVLGLAAVSLWVMGGAKFVVKQMIEKLGESTSPQLGTSWFSATYWRVAGIGALLTLPFLFAAAVQAVARSDLALLLRSALGYLPMAVLAVSIAAPVAMLLLSGSDELSALVSSATGQSGGRVFDAGTALTGGLSVFSQSPFFVFFYGLLIVLGAAAVWLELLMRDAAVYVVVLMLPLAFAALVWPARRVWAIRAVELLVALILSKFAIVAVLSLGGAAMAQLNHSISSPIVGLVLVGMAAFAPWVLLRLVPLAELAAAAAESFRSEAARAATHGHLAYVLATAGHDWASAATLEMRRGMAEPLPPSRPEPAAAVQDEATAGIAETGVEEPSVEETPDGGGVEDGRAADGQAPGASMRGQVAPHPTLSDQAGSDHPPGESIPATGSPQRLPGLPEMWQAEDLSWKPLVLGVEGEWPPQLWPPDPPEQPRPPGDRVADDHHLLPPPQHVLAADPDPTEAPVTSPHGVDPPAAPPSSAEPPS